MKFWFTLIADLRQTHENLGVKNNHRIRAYKGYSNYFLWMAVIITSMRIMVGGLAQLLETNAWKYITYTHLDAVWKRRLYKNSGDLTAFLGKC